MGIYIATIYSHAMTGVSYIATYTMHGGLVIICVEAQLLFIGK